MFFQDRTWRLLVEGSAAAPDEVERFADWVGDGQVDLKRADALACLAVAAALQPTPGASPAAPTAFTAELARQVRLGRKARLASS